MIVWASGSVALRKISGSLENSPLPEILDFLLRKPAFSDQNKRLRYQAVS
jgi:hypothetical protein